jgi:hypothetical protein
MERIKMSKESKLLLVCLIVSGITTLVMVINNFLNISTVYINGTNGIITIVLFIVFITSLKKKRQNEEKDDGDDIEECG